MEIAKRNKLIDIGRWPTEATAAKNGMIIEIAAPEANMTARRPRLANCSDDRSILIVRTGTFEASPLIRGICNFVRADRPNEYSVNRIPTDLPTMKCVRQCGKKQRPAHEIR